MSKFMEQLKKLIHLFMFWRNRVARYPRTIRRTHRKIGRNELCRCGSKLKYKYCHWKEDYANGTV